MANGGRGKSLTKEQLIQQDITCVYCGETKSYRNYFPSKVGTYADGGYMTICRECFYTMCSDKKGDFDAMRLKTSMKEIGRPFFIDVLQMAINTYAKDKKPLQPRSGDTEVKRIVDLYMKYLNKLAKAKKSTFNDSDKVGYVRPDYVARKNGVLEFPLKAKGKCFFKEGLYDHEQAIDIYYKEHLGGDTTSDFQVTSDIIRLFGEGFAPAEYRKMYEKYEKLKMNYTLQTNLHQEALATYVRFKVKEEAATAANDVESARKWYNAAQDAASNGKLTPKQLTAADLQKGVNSFSELTMAIEQATDVVNVLPKYKSQPLDAPDFTIWCYVNYERKLRGLPLVDYKDIYEFYDERMYEYLDQYGDPYGVFTEQNETMNKNRPNIEKFIQLPDDYYGEDNQAESDEEGEADESEK